MLASLFTAPIIGTVMKWLSSTVLTAYQAHLTAVNSHETQVVDIATKQLALDQREAELNAATIVAEQGNWITRSVRPALALPVIVLMWKLIVWDKTLGEWTHGHTDPLSPELWSYVNTVVIAYMGGRSIEKVADKIAGVFKQ